MNTSITIPAEYFIELLTIGATLSSKLEESVDERKKELAAKIKYKLSKGLNMIENQVSNKDLTDITKSVSEKWKKEGLLSWQFTMH